MSDSQPPRQFALASSHPFHPSTDPSPTSLPQDSSMSTSSQPQTDIPLTNMPPPPTYAGHRPNSHNLDLEAALPPPEPARNHPSPESPPDYKEQDMPEPLPPYMTRVRGVVRGQQPLAAAVPAMERRTGWLVVTAFALIVVIIIGVGIGVRVAANNNDNNNPPP